MRRIVRSLSVTLWACAFMAIVATAADDNKVIFPGGSGASGAPAPAPGSAGMGNVTLVVGLVLAAVGGWFVWRGRMSAPLGKAAQQLAISETRPLGNRQYLVVATYEDKKFLLGVCPGRIDLLAPLHEGEANGRKAGS